MQNQNNIKDKKHGTNNSTEPHGERHKYIVLQTRSHCKNNWIS